MKLEVTRGIECVEFDRLVKIGNVNVIVIKCEFHTDSSIVDKN